MSDKTRLLYLTTNFATTFIIGLGLLSDYLSFSQFTINLSGVSNYISYEDVKGSVFTSFSNFESFACRKSRNDQILTVCGNIFTFELSGLILKISIILTILLNLLVIYSVLHKKLFSPLPYASSVVYFIGSFSYITMNSGKILDPNDEKVILVYESGIFLLFMGNILLILNCFYFFYYAKVQSLRFGELLEVLQEGPEEKVDIGSTDRQDLMNRFNSLVAFVYERISESVRVLEGSQVKEDKGVSEKVVESLAVQIEVLSKLQGIYKESRVADEVESTKRYPSSLSFGRSQDASTAVASDKVDRLANENHELKLELSRVTVRSESVIEENERHKKILDNHKQVLVDKQLRIEELDKAKRNAEAREQGLVDSNNELKKYLKDYEELLIQLKKEKDELFKALSRKDKDLELLTSQLALVKTENSALKGEVSSENPANKSLNDIQIESLTSQVSVLSETIENLSNDNKLLKQKLTESEKLAHELDSKLSNSVLDYQKSLEKIYELESKPKTLLEANQRLDEQVEVNENLQNRLKTLENKLKDVKEPSLKENEAYAKLQQAEEEFERIKEELVHSSAQQSREIEILQARLKSQESFFEKELQQTQLALEAAKDELKKQEIQCEFYKAEFDRLEALEKQLESALPENLSSLQQTANENSEKSSQNLIKLSNQIEQILKEKEKLRKKLQKTEAELQQVSEECQNLHKLKFENKKDSTISMGSVESSSKSIQDSLIIEGISPSIVFHNPLIEKLSQLRKEPAMVYSSVWKNLEQMVLEKFKKDKKDIELGKDPQNVADFMFEFLQTQYGLKSLGLKQLKALIVSLEELYKIQHPYATFFCRILGIFHPRPIPSKVAVGLFASIVHFNPLCRRQSVKNENFADLYETLQFGGEASIMNVITLIKKIFKEHRAAGERILNTLHIDQPDTFELKLLRICAQLRAIGASDDALFVKDSMDYSEFIDNLRVTLDVWISQEEAELLCKALDDENKGEVVKSSWKEKINFESFCGMLESKPAMVTKADFLNSFVAEHEFEVLEDYHILRRIIVKGNPINAELTSYYLLQIEANLSIDFQERLFKEALVHDGGHGKEVSSEALCIVILKHNIGGYGKGLFFLNTLSS